MNRIIIVLGLALLLVCCRQPGEQYSEAAGVIVTWHLDSLENASRACVTLTIENRTGVLLDSGWTLYYSQFASVDPRTSDPQLRPRHITGDYQAIAPARTFTALHDGTKGAYQLRYHGLVRRISDAPHGMYMVDRDGNVSEVDLRVSGINAVTLAALDPPTAADRYQDNDLRYPDDLVKVAPIIPTPVHYQRTSGVFALGPVTTLYAPDDLKDHAAMLISGLERFGVEVRLVTDTTADIRMDEHDGRMLDLFDAYSLGISTEQIELRGNVFYAIQSLMALVPQRYLAGEQPPLELPCVQILDGARFWYRGLHVDVSRNFHGVEHLRRIIDQMAFFKLNQLHLTLTNDEGWRLEIPGLPELTEIGSLRGHTTDESDRLFPAYGSGPHTLAANNNGTGFLTRSEFIALLQYAHERSISIIPEIDVPGHARAAIKAMQARERRLLAEGKEAEALAYRLHDPQDTSRYRSAQNYSDNVICVCQESTYDFIEHVIGEIAGMYEEAQVPLDYIHSGGDEVPVGVWEGSPQCAVWIAEKALDGPLSLGAYFQRRFIDIVRAHDAIAAGWEEVVLAMDASGHNTTDINPDFLTPRVQVMPYVWNAVWGWGREDMAYRLANAGYPIVMCNSSALYFDLAYDKDPLERGLSWSGYVDTRTAFNFQPLNMFALASTDMHGKPLDEAHIASMQRLAPGAESNVNGIQGQLWGETITDSDMLDYYLFPKLLALSERAWTSEPEWLNAPTRTERRRGLDDAWAQFAAVVGQEVLPRLDLMFGSVEYRIPLPGAIVRNDTLYANVRYPGLTIRYTTDGTEPLATSSVFTQPVQVGSTPVKLKAFSGNGRMSRTSVAAHY